MFFPSTVRFWKVLPANNISLSVPTLGPSALIQEGQLSSYWQSISLYVHLILVSRLGGLHRNGLVRLSDRPDMTIVVTVDVKQHFG